MRSISHPAVSAISCSSPPRPRCCNEWCRPLRTEPITRDRLVPLEGGQNFRDLGGYAAADGRRTRWELIYRSGSMTRFSPTDFATMRAIGIRSVVDLRSTRERMREPVSWPVEGRPAVSEEDYTLDTSLLLAPLAAGQVTETSALAAMAAFGADLPYRFAHRYRDLFAFLRAGTTPLVVNCSAGKDRTGVAAALILLALGVDRETVVEDYLLSNTHFDPRKTLATDASADSRWRQLPPALGRVLTSVHAGTLDAAIHAIDRRSGGIDAYFETELGMSPTDIATLRAMYLE